MPTQEPQGVPNEPPGWATDPLAHGAQRRYSAGVSLKRQTATGSPVIGWVAAILGVGAAVAAFLFGSAPFWSLSSFGVGAAGLAGIIVGIVSAATNRGRAYGIIGIVMGSLSFLINAVT